MRSKVPENYWSFLVSFFHAQNPHWIPPMKRPKYEPFKTTDFTSEQPPGNRFLDMEFHEKKRAKMSAGFCFPNPRNPLPCTPLCSPEDFRFSDSRIRGSRPGNSLTVALIIEGRIPSLEQASAISFSRYETANGFPDLCCPKSGIHTAEATNRHSATFGN